MIVRAIGGSGSRHLRAVARERHVLYARRIDNSGTQIRAPARRHRTGDAIGQKDADDLPEGSYQVYAAGTDYPAYEASYPKNLAQLPLIKSPNGQADVTTSDVLNGAYP